MPSLQELLAQLQQEQPPEIPAGTPVPGGGSDLSGLVAPSQPPPPPKNPNFLRGLLTNYVQTLAENLQSGAFQRSVGRGIRVGKAPGGSAGAAFGESFGALPQEAEEIKKLAFMQRLQTIRSKMEEQESTRQDEELTLAKKRETRMAKYQGARQQTTAAKAGLEFDAEGTLVPIPKERLSVKEQEGLADRENLKVLREAQTELAQARTEAVQAGIDPESPVFKLKVRGIEERKHAAEAALGLRFAAEQRQREALDYRIEGPSTIAKGVADQGRAIQDIGSRLKAYIRKNPNNFGPIVGRIVEVEARLGTIDPELAGFYTELQSFYSAQGKLHGWRAIRTKEEFQKAINALVRNPEASIASIEAVERTAGSFIKAGTYNRDRTAGAEMEYQRHPETGELYQRPKGSARPWVKVKQ